MLQILRRNVATKPRPNWLRKNSSFKLLRVDRLEEENWPWYTPQTYYPVRIGEILNSRCKVIGKLGYGAHSTVWLGKDITDGQFVALKICERNSEPAERELAAYKHIASRSITHAGMHLLRPLLDSFRLGEHICLVHEPLGVSVESLRRLLGGKIPVDLLKGVLKYLLLVLDCLHTEAKVVHADIQASNIQFGSDESIFNDFEEGESQDPSPRKVDGKRIVYESRGLRLPKEYGHPVLCDLGEARYGSTSYTDLIHPTVYRAPEVILGMPWSYPVDIWNVGVLIWSLFEDHELFKAEGSADQYIKHRLAQMYAMLGPPPLDFLQRSETSRKYFEADGTFKEASLIPDTSLEASEQQLTGEDKAQFLTFVRKMLRWAPEQRSTAAELLKDPWLMA